MPQLPMRRQPARNSVVFSGRSPKRGANCFSDRKLYDIAAVAARDKWPSTEKYAEHLIKLIEGILVEGRTNGEFERKTPLDEATHAVYLVMCPFVNPVQLQFNLEAAPKAAVLLSSLILRSLAP